MSDLPHPLAALERLVQKTVGESETLNAEEMPGGASTRRFFRVDLGRGKSSVAMFVPDATQPDEIGKTDESGRRWPFLEVRDLLAERGVAVPAVIAEGCDEGLLLLEDLGEDTLANYLCRNPQDRERLYQIAVRDLAMAQQALAKLPDGSIVAERSFDADLLRWELDHFREWALDARDMSLSDADRAQFDEIADTLAKRISSWSYGFVHRDYQSRNLMVRQDDDGQPQLVWIDFQDALLGPRVYDLVALLSDSYQTFDRDFIEKRLDEYAAHLEIGSEERTQIGREFDLVTVQRKLKDAGRFVFIDQVKRNPSFLRFVEPTIAKARAALERAAADDQQLQQLAELLERHLGPAEASN